MVKIFLLMLLLHIIDDFVLQPICLSKLKQKKWWRENIKSGSELKKYEDDYIAALIIHSLSWSIMIHLPLFFFVDDTSLLISIMINMIIHYIVDDCKANLGILNLSQDQTIHLLQVFITSFILL